MSTSFSSISPHSGVIKDIILLLSFLQKHKIMQLHLLPNPLPRLLSYPFNFILLAMLALFLINPTFATAAACNRDDCYRAIARYQHDSSPTFCGGYLRATSTGTTTKTLSVPARIATKCAGPGVRRSFPPSR